ncbi:MAG: GNAT family N-acetyltransferase [Acidobacteriota bacterium]
MLLTNRLTDLEISEVIDSADFLALEIEWNALVEATNNEPFYRHEFIRIWLHNFAPDAKLRILTARNSSGRLVAVLPIMERFEFLGGFPTRQLVSTSNSHSCRFDVIALNAETAGIAFFGYLAASKNWDVITIKDVPNGGNAWHLIESAKRAGFLVGDWESQRSPYIIFPPSFDEVLKGLSKNFRRYLRRNSRNLKNHGVVTIECVTDATYLDKYLSKAFSIEQSGWKGRNGTAIAQNQHTYNFYRELAHVAAEHNYLSLNFLNLNGRAIAFHYGLTNSEVYFTPKVGYDEAFKEFSPSYLLDCEVIKDCISRKLRAYDLLGDIFGIHNEWKQKWSKVTCPHKWLFIFRDSFYGRLLWKTKFSWIPATKRFISSWS